MGPVLVCAFAMQVGSGGSWGHAAMHEHPVLDAALQGNVEQIDHGIGQGRLCYGLC